MIQAVYDRDECRLTVTGHAHSDEFGKDLICAAVSALVITMAANVNHLADDGYVTDNAVRLEPGNAMISCTPVPEYSDSVRQIFMAVCVGFEVLASKLPEYILYVCRDRES